MCKHVLNAQVAVRAACCRKWFDCPQCHEESEDHQLRKVVEMVFACKKCKKVFRKDMSNYDETDEYCPHCDNKYVIEAKSPELALGFETDDPRQHKHLFQDHRMKTGLTSTNVDMEELERELMQP